MMEKKKKLNLSCSVCKRLFCEKNHAEEHKMCHTEVDSRNEEANWCDICKKSFEDSTYKEHIQTEHEPDFSNIEEVNGNEEASGEASNWCQVCRQSFEDSAYEIHVQTEHQSDSSNLVVKDFSDLMSMMDEDGFVLVSKRHYKKCIMSSMDSTSSESNDANSVPVAAGIMEEPIEMPDEERNTMNMENNIQNTTSKQAVIIQSSLRAKRSSSKKSISQVSSSSSSSTPKKSAKLRRNVPSKKSVALKKKKCRIPYIKCPTCKIMCKGQKGLNIHNRMAHTSKGRNSSDKDSEEEKGNNVSNSENLNLNQRPPGSLYPMQPNVDILPGMIPISLPRGGAILPNASFPLPSIPFSLPNLHISLSGVPSVSVPISMPDIPVVSPNLVFLRAPASVNVRFLEVVPKFDENSLSYIKWVTEFMYKCKNGTHPLPHIICENVKCVLNDIENAISDPHRFLNKKEARFYFIKIHKVLSEIMIDHMRYS